LKTTKLNTDSFSKPPVASAETAVKVAIAKSPCLDWLRHFGHIPANVLSFLSNYSDLLKDSAALNAFNIRRLSSRVVGGPFDLSVSN
jgi:hypothetical protein